MRKSEHSPGEFAPASGDYEQINIFGLPNGIRTSLALGQMLPLAPVGHRWRPVDQRPVRRSIDTYVGNRLRHLRAESGVPLSALSARTDVAEASIAAYERGETRPPPADLLKLAKAFGVALAELFPESPQQVSGQLN